MAFKIEILAIDFLKFPSELRNIIYEIMVEDCVVDTRCKGGIVRCSASNSHDNPTPDSVGMLLSCKQIYKEAILIHYDTITVKLGYFPTGLFACLTSLPDKYATRISQLLVHHVTDIMSRQTEVEEKRRQERGMLSRVRSVLMDLHITIKERMITAQWE